MATKRTKTPQTPILADRTKDYAAAVVAGEIIAGPHVRNACRRHLDDLKRTDGIWFDHDAANRAFGFFENVLKLSEGQFEGQPFNLHPAQAFIIGSLFGWKRADGTRRFRRAYIEQGKGNGKSPMAGGVGLYGLTADGEAGAQIYAAAAKKDQAAILFQDACKMVRAAPALAKRLQFAGGIGREFNIAYLPTGSFFRPVSRDTGKTGSGPRPYFVLADEVHELPDRSIIEMLERGFKFRREPLLFMITNSGSNRNSVAWEEHEHAIKVAAGNYEAVNDPAYLGEIVDDTTFAYVCALDPEDDPLSDPSCWIKANPLLGVTITEEYLREVVAQAKAIPGKLNGILRLHFCVWTEAETAWMTRSTLENTRAMTFGWASTSVRTGTSPRWGRLSAPAPITTASQPLTHGARHGRRETRWARGNCGISSPMRCGRLTAISMRRRGKASLTATLRRLWLNMPNATRCNWSLTIGSHSGGSRKTLTTLGCRCRSRNIRRAA
jgi:phage terminase large subunit-like protein